MDDDLLVTNAFVPILALEDNNREQKVRLDYNYSRPNKKPYQKEELGPYPNVNVKDEKTYDAQTTYKFKDYLKKKNKLVDFDKNISAQYSDNPFGFKDIGKIGETSSSTKEGEDFDDDNEYNKEYLLNNTVFKPLRTSIQSVYTINIDSQFRNDPTTQNFWNYTINLPIILRNIIMVEIKSSEFNCKDAPTGDSGYIIVTSNALGVMLGSTSATKNIFTKIQVPEDKVGKLIFNGHVVQTIVYPNALPELQVVDFALFNSDGGVYQNTGFHSFTLQFITYFDTMNFNDISSRRGAKDRTEFQKYIL